MSNRRSLVATVAAATLVAIALGSAVGVRIADDPGRTPVPSADGSAHSNAPATGSPSSTAEPRSGTKHGGPGQGSAGEDTPEDGGAEAAPPPPSASPEGQESSATRGGVAVVPEAPGPADDYALDPHPPSASPSPPAYSPPTTPASARGRLVAGYPARLLPSAPRSAVVSSSVAPSPDRVQVALVARRSSSSTSVLGFYRDLMGAAGFREAQVDAVGGSQAIAFRRGAERVVVTVDSDPARTYSVYATLVAAEG
jgi:hypothetical protein